MKYLKNIFLAMAVFGLFLCLSNNVCGILAGAREIRLKISNIESSDDLKVYLLVSDDYIKHVMKWYIEEPEGKEYYLNKPDNQTRIEKIYLALNDANYFRAIELDKRENGGIGVFNGGINGYGYSMEESYYVHRGKKYVQILMPDYFMNPENSWENSLGYPNGHGEKDIIIRNRIETYYEELDFKYLVKGGNRKETVLSLDEFKYSPYPYGIENYELLLEYDYSTGSLEEIAGDYETEKEMAGNSKTDVADSSHIIIIITISIIATLTVFIIVWSIMKKKKQDSK